MKKTGFYRRAAGEAALDFRCEFLNLLAAKRSVKVRRGRRSPRAVSALPKGLTLTAAENQSLIYHPGGRTGPIRACPPVAVPTDGTPQTPVWRQGPQQPGRAWGAWSTAGQPGWAWTGSTCTGTRLHLQGQRSLIIYRDNNGGSEAAPTKIKEQTSGASQHPVKNTHKPPCLLLRVWRLLSFSSVVLGLMRKQAEREWKRREHEVEVKTQLSFYIAPECVSTNGERRRRMKR